MQLTTDTSTIESRERSITKAVDVIAKIMRERYKLFLDGRNITDNTLTELGMQNSAIQEYVVKQIKLVRDLKEIHIGIPADRQDTIEVDFSVLPYYALNYIKVTLYI
jgi:DNA-binding protein